ncbi:cilia- and flagella-associated protein 43-like isoform X2 [Ptychodera flava]|uniref:cilia- and flagella-associated protein 43-like isoform X2 n=1 Tax=Ptychodera flava TaxID=63121 RepID=UPI00396A0737
MDAIGSLELAWAQGYNGSKAEYISHNTICYACGSNVNFYNTDDKKETAYPSLGGGIHLIAVSNTHHTVAIAEQAINPRIFIHSYPGFIKTAVCENGAQLEYAALAFSYSGRYLASYSGLPEFKLSIWHWETGDLLCSKELDGLPATDISFNPMDWHKVCVIGPEQLTFWNIEQSNKKYVLLPAKVKLPAEDGTVDDRMDDASSRMSTRAVMYGIKVDLATKAGLVGELAETFEDDLKKRVVPVSHCWTPKSEVYFGCEGGQLFKVDSESHTVKLLYKPTLPSNSVKDAGSPELIREDSDLQLPSSPNYNNTLGEGSLSYMKLHKDGLYVGGEDATLRCLTISRDEINLSDSWPCESAITSLSWSSSYNKLAVGSSMGAVHIYDPASPGSAEKLFDHHHGNFLGVDILSPGTQHCVTVRQSGEVQVWTLEKPQLVSSISISRAASCIACCPSSKLAAVGTLSGHVYMIEFNNVENPRVVQRLAVHRTPVLHLVFEQYGRYLLTGSDDGHVFIMDPRPSVEFNILGHVLIDGLIMSISCNTPDKNGDTKVVVTSNLHQKDASKNPAPHKIIQFDLKKNFIKDFSQDYHVSLKCDLKDEVINRMNLNFAVPSYGAAVGPGEIIYAISYNHKRLCKIQLPDEPPKKMESPTPSIALSLSMSPVENNKASYLQPLAEFPGHELPGGKVVLSPHQKWLATCAPDGRVHVRTMDDMEKAVSVRAHTFRQGGVNSMVFSADSMYLITCGANDGTVSCYTWNFTTFGKNKYASAVEMSRTLNVALNGVRKKEDEVLANMMEWFPTTSQSGSRAASVIEKDTQELSEKEKAVENDQIYTTPTPIPSSDATWLELQELEAIKEEDKQYADMKKDLRTDIRDLRRTIQAMMKQNETLPEMEKLAHQEFNLDTEEQQRLEAEGQAEVEMIREDIEFENLAMVYLRDTIKRTCWDSMAVKGRSLKAFHSNLEVTNYPMRDRTHAEKEILAFVTKIREIEIAELEARKEIMETPSKPGTAGENEEKELDDESEEGDGKEQPSTTGSLGAMFGGGSDLFYSQFELHTKQQKQNQIILLKDALYRIRTAFNKEFDEVYKMKEMEIARIKEKNTRIRKILEDLDSGEAVWQPEWSIDEKPERLLEVSDSEVKVEKYISPEQQAKLDEEAKIEEERRLREKADNARERALDMMMGGVLEVKKEDELKKDIPVPAFMSKPQEEWSEDEKKLAQDYERKVKELNEEREKYRKALESELKKLQTTLADTTGNFDDKLTDLFQKKIKTEMVINQEELKIVRLQFSLLQEEELGTKEAEIARRLKSRQTRKTGGQLAVINAKKEADQFRDTYDILVAEDKVLDKVFRREFNDVPTSQVDQLYKLFRRRPRGRRGAEHSMDLPSISPYGERPPSPRQQLSNLLKGLTELDDESHMPEGVELSVWERMCLARKNKLESEQNVKQKALVMADMNAFLQRRQEEDENLKAEIEELLERINNVQEEKLRFMCNLEVQFLLKQGQVEVDPGPFVYDHTDSILIHRGVTEDLNATIRQLGEQKIAAMTESKDFRKGIHVLEWEHNKNLMKIEDLLNKARDIQSLKVSRELQKYLNDADHESKKQQEIGKLEETLDLQDRHHEKNVRERKDILGNIRKVIRRKEKENSKLMRELQEFNVSVAERKHIDAVNADRHADSGAEKRMHDIVQRRKLVDLAKAQAQEVAVLRAEVERLRMRTFPALVQVEH